MKIKDFIKTEAGKKYESVLEGCSKNWEVEHWEDIEEYKECLQDNGWSDEDIEEQLEYISKAGEVYKANKDDDDFVVVIN